MSDPADRAFSASADAVRHARARRPEDASDPDVPVAATVVIAREGSDGPEVLMIERPDRGSFAGAWVFPGGKLEPDDSSGLPSDSDEVDVARRAGVRETWEETGLVLDADTLQTLSCWDPPPGIAARIRTWFFAATAPQGDLALSADEVVRAEWVRPGELLQRHARGEVTLYPPTWVTLHCLAGQPDATALVDAARLGGVQRFETAARNENGAPMLLWQEDGEYAADASSETRHRLVLGSLPWVYTREF